MLLDNAYDTAQVAPAAPGHTRQRRADHDPVPVARTAEARRVSRCRCPTSRRRWPCWAGSPATPRSPPTRTSRWNWMHACGQLPLALRIIGARAAARPGRGLGAQLLRLRAEEHQLDELRAGGISVEATFQVGYRALAPAQAG
ncbi:hypothetical protein ACRAWF_37610 [Streptomyces sp. L7]